MSVDTGEMLCYGYIAIIKTMEMLAGQNIRGFDQKRANIHEELCLFFGLTKEQSSDFTDHLENFKNGTELYLAFLNKSRTEKQTELEL